MVKKNIFVLFPLFFQSHSTSPCEFFSGRCLFQANKHTNYNFNDNERDFLRNKKGLIKSSEGKTTLRWWWAWHSPSLGCFIQKTSIFQYLSESLIIILTLFMCFRKRSSTKVCTLFCVVWFLKDVLLNLFVCFTPWKHCFTVFIYFFLVFSMTWS